jgi:hypothetical protein
MLVYRSLGLTARVRRTATMPDPTPAPLDAPAENRIEPMPAPVRPEPISQQRR